MTNPLLLEQLTIYILVIFICLLLYLFAKPIREILAPLFKLTRMSNNPLLSPHQLNDWETEGVFNPAAVLDDEGVVHLLYRALGGGLSRIGHASSKNGRHFDKRSPYPVYQPTPGYGLPPLNPLEPRVFDPVKYTSGGGWGGTEDPRAVCIDDRVYMTYTAFEGWHSVRMALTSIALEDLKHGKWRWKRALLLSAPGTVEKNWVLFPEKINGKYAVLHSISPKIKIEYIEDFDSFNGSNRYVASQNSPTRGGRETHWDNWMRGAGSPPIRTRLGWLLLYHAMDKNDPNKYKIGAMVLDLEDPTKITYRSPTPILEPDMHYENDWKPGVVYASGAVVKDGDLHVYYGGGDKFICAAHTNLESLLAWLEEHGRV